MTTRRLRALESERAPPMLWLAVLCSIALGAVVGAGIARAVIFAPTRSEGR